MHDRNDSKGKWIFIFTFSFFIQIKFVLKVPSPVNIHDTFASRWTRREECDFYRVVSTFGVEKIKKEPGFQEGPDLEFDWTRFRTFARLDKKTDESLSRYFRSFVAMCRRVCHLRPGRGEGKYLIFIQNVFWSSAAVINHYLMDFSFISDADCVFSGCELKCFTLFSPCTDPSELSQTVAPITEERASRTLYRISLLRRLRERVLPNPSLEEHLPLAPRSSELPAWWRLPEHDHQLMLGASLHGVSRTELSIYSDPQFTFSMAREQFIQSQQALPPPPPPPPPPIMTFSQPKPEMDLPRMKEDESDESVQLFRDEISAELQSTPLSHQGGKVQGQSWSFKRSKDRGDKTEGGRKGEGGSDSDSDSDSGSSSSERSGSSDDSGDSDEEGEGGRFIDEQKQESYNN